MTRTNSRNASSQRASTCLARALPVSFACRSISPLSSVASDISTTGAISTSARLQRVAKSVAGMYASRVTATESVDRMQQVAELMSERSVPFSVEGTAELPVLTAWACPYPTLAEQDRSICAMENMVFSELVGEKVKLSECRLEGGTCCRFQTS